MDRTLLSDPDVVGASRNLICVRLATYENAQEGKLLESIFLGGSGKLENTTFTILGPDGYTRLTGAGRSVRQVFPGPEEAAAEEMSATMRALARRYPGKKGVDRRLPYPADLRRGLVMAAADLQPLVVVAVADPALREKTETALAALAWSTEFVGRLAYASVHQSEELANVEGASGLEGVLFVEPDPFGLKGRVLARSAATETEGLGAMLRDGAGRFVVQAKDSWRHIREGQDQGVKWDTVIPITDPGGRGGPPGPGGPDRR
ncbi:MAG: hypothetical protein HYZ53_00085 [Planctomycetes bacterium]|nr:hypothetical protein [Planctomycetota bacterium]